MIDMAMLALKLGRLADQLDRPDDMGNSSRTTEAAALELIAAQVRDEALDDPRAALRDALGVIVLDPRIHAWLKANDPKALALAQEAFAAPGDGVPVRPATEA